MNAQLRFRDGFWQGVTWSRPDSPSPALCSKCSGGLPDVPLMLWRDDHSAVSFCDGCDAAHLVLYDEEDRPFAQAVIDDDIVTSLMLALHNRGTIPMERKQ